MQPATTQSRRSQQNRRSCMGCWLLLKQEVSSASSKPKNNKPNQKWLLYIREVPLRQAVSFNLRICFCIRLYIGGLAKNRNRDNLNHFKEPNCLSQSAHQPSNPKSTQNQKSNVSTYSFRSSSATQTKSHNS